MNIELSNRVLADQHRTCALIFDLRADIAAIEKRKPHKWKRDRERRKRHLQNLRNRLSDLEGQAGYEIEPSADDQLALTKIRWIEIGSYNSQQVINLGLCLIMRETDHFLSVPRIARLLPMGKNDPFGWSDVSGKVVAHQDREIFSKGWATHIAPLGVPGPEWNFKPYQFGYVKTDHRQPF